jgi:hypothetical protein
MRNRILAVNYRLFNDDAAITEWDRFLTAVSSSSTSAASTYSSNTSTSTAATAAVVTPAAAVTQLDETLPK